MLDSINKEVLTVYLKFRPLIKPISLAFTVGLVIGFVGGQLAGEGLWNKLGLNSNYVLSAESLRDSKASSLVKSKQEDNSGVLNNIEEVSKNESLQKQNEECDFYVDVAGAVKIPGVYCMKEGQIINDALNLASGVNTDLVAYKYVAQNMNFALKLEPFQKIYIPFQDDAKCLIQKEYDELLAKATKQSGEIQSQSTQETSVVQKDLTDNSIKSLCVSLNKASIEDLDTLEGVGIATAQKIIEGRPYSNIEEIMEVKGIGESMFNKIKSKICL